MSANYVVYFKDDVKTDCMNLFSVVNQLTSDGEVKLISPRVVVVNKTSNFTALHIKKSLQKFCKVESYVDSHPKVNGVNFKK